MKITLITKDYSIINRVKPLLNKHYLKRHDNNYFVLKTKTNNVDKIIFSINHIIVGRKVVAISPKYKLKIKE